jgi:hypothetical protein
MMAQAYNLSHWKVESEDGGLKANRTKVSKTQVKNKPDVVVHTCIPNF